MRVHGPGVHRVAAEQDARALVQEAAAVGRVAGRVQDRERPAAQVDPVAVPQQPGGRPRRPSDPGGGVEARPAAAAASSRRTGTRRSPRRSPAARASARPTSSNIGTVEGEVLGGRALRQLLRRRARGSPFVRTPGSRPSGPSGSACSRPRWGGRSAIRRPAGCGRSPRPESISAARSSPTTRNELTCGGSPIRKTSSSSCRVANQSLPMPTAPPRRPADRRP